MPALINVDGKLGRRGAALVQDDGVGNFCCCGRPCPCCTKRIIGATITLAGITSDAGCTNGACNLFDGAYWVPNNSGCSGLVTFELAPCFDPAETVTLTWTIANCFDVGANAQADIIVVLNGTFGAIAWKRTHTFIGDNEPVDCSGLNGSVPNDGPNTGGFCLGGGSTATVAFEFSGD